MLYKRGKTYWYNFRWSIKQADGTVEIRQRRCRRRFQCGNGEPPNGISQVPVLRDFRNTFRVITGTSRFSPCVAIDRSFATLSGAAGDAFVRPASGWKLRQRQQNDWIGGPPTMAVFAFAWSTVPLAG
jgi:hypothetical protein